MRILHVVRQFYPCVGGVEKYTLDLSRQLIARGHVSDVVSLNRDFASNSLLSPAEEYQGISIFRVPYFGPNRYKIAPAALRFVKKYDVVHVHAVDFFVDYLALARFWHKRPIVVSTHGGFFHSKWGSGFKKVFFNTITKLSMSAVDRVICDSHSDYSLFRAIAPHKSVVIENGVDYDSFASVTKQVQRGLLVFVGRTDANKRHDNLIRAFAAIANEFRDARLVFIGPDWLGVWKELKALAGRLEVGDRVVFAGYCPDHELLAYLSKAHFFVSASQYEGFGIAAVEAMSTGTVPVLNDIDTFRSFVDDGVSGLIADFDRPESAASTLRRAMALDDAAIARMGEKARAKARTYGWPEVVGKVEKVYEDVLHQAGMNNAGACT